MEDMGRDSWCFGVQMMLGKSIIMLVLRGVIIFMEKLPSQTEICILNDTGKKKYLDEIES